MFGEHTRLLSRPAHNCHVNITMWCWELSSRSGQFMASLSRSYAEVRNDSSVQLGAMTTLTKELCYSIRTLADLFVELLWSSVCGLQPCGAVESSMCRRRGSTRSCLHQECLEIPASPLA